MNRSILVLLLIAASASAQRADTAFVLDGSKPYAYLQFDHVGPRKPTQQGEDSEGLWLRIVNNCKVTIAVKSYGVTSGDPGVGVFDEIIPIRQKFMVQADSDKDPVKTDETRFQKMPHGYSAELSSETRVLPGKSLLFSVPRNHVSTDWFMRVKFTLDVNKPSVGMGPETELDFFNEEIPSRMRQ